MERKNVLKELDASVGLVREVLGMNEHNELVEGWLKVAEESLLNAIEFISGVKEKPSQEGSPAHAEPDPDLYLRFWETDEARASVCGECGSMKVHVA